MNEKIILGLADQVNLDINKFKNDLELHNFREQVASEIKEGINYGVQGTLAFFNNEMFYDGKLSFKALKGEIDNLL